MLLFVGFLQLRGSIRDAVAGSFLLGYLWLLSQPLFLPVYAMEAEFKYETFKAVELAEREYLARREAAKQS